MIDTLSLFQIADTENIALMVLDIPENGSMCIQTDAGRSYIGMDYQVLSTMGSIRVHLAHELGHCTSDSFYNRYTSFDIRQKHENRADKWAIKKLVPKDELDDAVSRGITEPWDLAEHFNVTEDFMKKAICY